MENEELRNRIAGQIYANLMSKHLAGELSICKLLDRTQEHNWKKSVVNLIEEQAIKYANRFVCDLPYIDNIKE